MAKANKPSQPPNGDSPDIAYVTPALVAWALKRSRVSVTTVAQKLRVDSHLVEAWQEPNGPRPSFVKAQELAKLLHIPFGFLYLSEPPSADLPLPDFRGFDRAYKPSSDLLELLNDILVKQDWFREHEKDVGAGPLKFVGSYSIRNSIDEVANAIRTRLGITVAVRQSASTWSDYLSILTRRAENVGILVMRSGVVGNVSTRRLQARELLGFAISDPLAPIVFVNSSDYRASQIFTFAHELAHLWIGETAIANPDELEVGRNKTEAFCNRVAAEVLVPQREFLNEWRSITASTDTKVNRVTKRFWVSSYVALRRAKELNELSVDEYERLRKIEAGRRKKEGSSGGDYYRNVLTRMSPKFTEAVLNEVNGGKLELRDAAGLLSMKVPTLVRFAEKHK